MKIVVKIGGTLLEDAPARARMAMMLRPLASSSRDVLVVHGGGKQLTSFLEKTGVKSEFLNGLRVTSAEALDGVVKVFAGSVNHNLLAALHAAGVPAVGLSGIDAGCLTAERLQGPQGEDWGYVGRIVSANPRVWEALLAARLLPVMACLAVGNDGQVYNVNADQAAVACAVHWRADALVFLTDVDGVRDSSGAVVPRIAADEIPAMLRSGAVTGGMLAKLSAVEEAAAGGVSQIVIRNGRRDHALEHLLESGPVRETVGTVIVSPLAAGKKM